MSKLPKVAVKGSIRVEVKQGETYYWCACGLSASQPFCDGSHKDTGLAPLKYTADENKIVGFCGCKHSKKQPLCDGSHKFLDNE